PWLAQLFRWSRIRPVRNNSGPTWERSILLTVGLLRSGSGLVLRQSPGLVSFRSVAEELKLLRGVEDSGFRVPGRLAGVDHFLLAKRPAPGQVVAQPVHRSADLHGRAAGFLRARLVGRPLRGAVVVLVAVVAHRHAEGPGLPGEGL